MTAAGGASVKARLPEVSMRLLVPGAAIAALALASSRQPSTHEALFLLLLAAAALVIAALAAPRPAVEAEVAAVALVALGWAFPDSPARAAVTTLVALAAVAVALARRFVTTPQAPLALWATAATSAHLFTSTDELLRMATATEALLWLLPPALTTAACVLLVRRRPRWLALAAWAAAMLPDGRLTLGNAAALLALGAALSLGESGRWRWLAGGSLGVAAAIEPRLALFALVAAATLWRRWAAMAAAAICLVGSALVPARGVDEALALLPLLLILLPALAFGLVRRPKALLAPAALALAAALGMPATALAFPAAWLIVEQDDHPSTDLTFAWLAALGAGTLILGLYPWTRPLALSDALGWLGLGLDWPSAGLLVALAALAGWSLGRRAPRQRRAAFATVGTALAIALLLVPGSGRGVELLGGTAVAIDHGTPSRTFHFPSRVADGLVLDTSLANADEISPGTAVAVLILRGEDGGELAHWQLRAGHDTAEWSVRRLGVPPALPRPWLSWLADRRLLGQRYRAELAASSGSPSTTLEVALARDAPAGIVLTLFHLQVLG